MQFSISSDVLLPAYSPGIAIASSRLAKPDVRLQPPNTHARTPMQDTAFSYEERASLLDGEHTVLKLCSSRGRVLRRQETRSCIRTSAAGRWTRGRLAPATRPVV